MGNRDSSKPGSSDADHRQEDPRHRHRQQPFDRLGHRPAAQGGCAELGITYLPDDKGRFEAKVRELTARGPSLFLPLNVQDADQMAEVFERQGQVGRVDGLVTASPLRARRS